MSQDPTEMERARVVANRLQEELSIRVPEAMRQPPASERLVAALIDVAASFIEPGDLGLARLMADQLAGLARVVHGSGPPCSVLSESAAFLAGTAVPDGMERRYRSILVDLVDRRHEDPWFSSSDLGRGVLLLAAHRLCATTSPLRREEIAAAAAARLLRTAVERPADLLDPFRKRAASGRWPWWRGRGRKGSVRLWRS